MNEKFVMPWEERPADCKEVMWRYSKNPVIGRYQIPSSNSIFNSAVVPFKDGFAGVFRCDNRAVQMNIFAGFSKDGINWEINHEPIVFKPGNTEMIDSEYKYDPRVTWIEDRYWITSPCHRKVWDCHGHPMKIWSCQWKASINYMDTCLSPCPTRYHSPAKEMIMEPSEMKHSLPKQKVARTG